MLNNPRIETEKLLSLHPSLTKRVITIAYESKSSATLEEAHLISVIELAHTRKNGSISLPRGINAIFEDGILRFEDFMPDIRKIDYSVGLNLGVNRIEGTPFTVIISKNGHSETVSEPEGELFAKAELFFSSETAIFARNRREGDIILSNGMHKKVKKLLCDRKIPLSLRDLLPMICTEDGIAYIPKCATNDAFSKNGSGKQFTISVYLKR